MAVEGQQVIVLGQPGEEGAHQRTTGEVKRPVYLNGDLPQRLGKGLARQTGEIDSLRREVLRWTDLLHRMVAVAGKTRPQHLVTPHDLVEAPRQNRGVQRPA